MALNVSNFSLTQSGSRISDLAVRLGQWWLKEFLLLFPDRVSEWLTDRGYKRLTLWAEPDVFVLQLLNDRRRLLASTRIARNMYSPAAIDDFLKVQKLDRGGVVVGIRLPRDQIFSRQIILPMETAGSIAKIIIQDLVAKTPFRLADIYHDHHSRPVNGKMAVWQWIIRREFVASAAETAGLSLADLVFVESEGKTDDGGPAPVLSLRQDQHKRRSWLRKAFRTLAILVLLFASVAFAHKYWRQHRILDNLAIELAAAKAKAQQVRAVMDKLEQRQTDIAQLRLQKRDIAGLLDVWEEVSKILPENSWLTELRLSEVAQKQDRMVVMTGLSTAAADLVALVDKSSLFADAALTAPIAVDSVEQRERFTLQAKLQKKRPIEKPAP